MVAWTSTSRPQQAPTVSALAPTLVGAPLGLQLAVLGGGVRMPVAQVVEAQPLQAAPVVVPEAAAVAVAPAPYVAPFHPRKQDRN